MNTEPIHSLADMAGLAQACISRAAWDFIEGGSGDELSVLANRAALDAQYLVPRVLRDVSGSRTDCTVLGSAAATPVAIAPMAYHRLVHPEGELATAHAAKSAGVPFTVPMLSSVAVEDVAKAGARLWFQLYWLRDRGVTADLIARAEAAGCEALMLTVDVPRMGRRLRDRRNSFALPADVRAVHFPPQLADTAQQGRAHSSAVAIHTQQAFDPALSWADLEWLRARTELPIILKGVLAAADAEQAVKAGAAALVVSNHGGRQLDGAVPGIAALPAVRDAVGGDCELYVDGGIRSGSDVLKALAAGASAVLLGRPVLHGLAVDGARGANEVLSILAGEFSDALALAGCRDLADAAGLQLMTLGAS